MSDTTSIVVGAVSAFGTALSGIALVLARRRWQVGDRREQTTDELREDNHRWQNWYQQRDAQLRYTVQAIIVANDARIQKKPGWETLIELAARTQILDLSDNAIHHDKPGTDNE